MTQVQHGDEIALFYINEGIEKQLRNEGPEYIVNGDFKRPVIISNTVSLTNQGVVLGWQAIANDEVTNGTGGLQ